MARQENLKGLAQLGLKQKENTTIQGWKKYALKEKLKRNVLIFIINVVHRIQSIIIIIKEEVNGEAFQIT